MDDGMWRVVGYGLIGAGVYAGLMTLLWAMCVMAGRADAAAQAEEQRRRLALVRGRR